MNEGMNEHSVIAQKVGLSCNYFLYLLKENPSNTGESKACSQAQVFSQEFITRMTAFKYFLSLFPVAPNLDHSASVKRFVSLQFLNPISSR
jgi:hypothetical protein